MKISVALCTYNGSAYLDEQLGSIARQSRLPDELVICDDASTDATLGIARAFASRVPFRVSVVESARNLGTTKNFERAIAACAGDVIVLSDQDDSWLPRRIEDIADAFAKRPELTLAFADAMIADEMLRPGTTRLWQTQEMTPARLQRIRHGGAFEDLLNGNFVTGATMAFAARVCEVALPIPALQGRIHDGWLALVAAALGATEPLPAPAIHYRQHPKQQLGALERVSPLAKVRRDIRKLLQQQRSSYLEGLDDLATLEARLREWRARLPDESPLIHLQRLREHRLVRHSLPAARLARIPAIAREWLTGRYRYSFGVRGVLRDLLSA